MCPFAASQAILILYTVGRSCERGWPSCGLEEIILCSLKVIYIVCYIARVPVCVCDGRTILFCPVLGVFCDDARNAQRNANSQIIIRITNCKIIVTFRAIGTFPGENTFLTIGIVLRRVKHAQTRQKQHNHHSVKY